MKYVFLVISVILVGLYSCDTIEGEYIDRPVIVPPIDSVNPGNDSIEYESVTIFEFTGWACVYCPNGHEQIALLEEFYPERIQAIAIHEGGFAEPGNDGPDLRSDVGYAMWERFGKPQNFPLGTVNDMNGINLVGPDSWSALVADAYDRSKNNAEVLLTFHDTVIDNQIKVNVSLKFTKELTGEFNLSLFVVESEIIAPQKHFSQGLIEEYEHNHVLRASMFNGIIGEQVGLNPTIGKTFEKNYTLEVYWEWEAQNIHVVPFIYNVKTNEVIPTQILKPKK